MSFQKVCQADDLWEGEMFEFGVGSHRVLVLRLDGGEVRAFQAACPHQDIPLAEGLLDGRTLTCRAHQWTFDVATGEGINPGHCRLACYPVRVDGDDVLVEVEGVTPQFAQA